MLLAQETTTTTNDGLSVAVVSVLVIGGLVLAVLHIAGMWKTYEKAGESGPMSLLQIVGCLAPIAWYPATRLSGRPGWWVVLLYIPLVNIIVLLILCMDIAKSFGKSAAYGIGLWLLGFIFFPMLGFGSARYEGPSAGPAGGVRPAYA